MEKSRHVIWQESGALRLIRGQGLCRALGKTKTDTDDHAAWMSAGAGLW